MKAETRGAIETFLDSILQIKDPLKGIKWVEENIPTKSIDDLALGYVIGKMETAATTVFSIIEQKQYSEIEMETEREQIRAMVRRRLPEILVHVQSELNK